jgi:hypothetical protein
LGKSENSTAQKEAEGANGDHDNVEVSPAGSVRCRAKRKPNHREGNDDPIGPAQQRNEGQNDKKERDRANKERDDVALSPMK